MSALEWLVTLGGAAAIAWVNWYFFLARRGKTTSAGGETADDAAVSRPVRSEGRGIEETR